RRLFSGEFKMHRVGLVLTIAVATAFAQNPKSVSKLSDFFAKSAIKALFAVQRWSDRHDKASEKKAEEAVHKARAEHNPDNPAEAHMMSKLAYFVDQTRNCAHARRGKRFAIT